MLDNVRKHWSVTFLLVYFLVEHYANIFSTYLVLTVIIILSWLIRTTEKRLLPAFITFPRLHLWSLQTIPFKISSCWMRETMYVYLHWSNSPKNLLLVSFYDDDMSPFILTYTKYSLPYFRRSDENNLQLLLNFYDICRNLFDPMYSSYFKLIFWTKKINIDGDIASKLSYSTSYAIFSGERM